MGLPAFRCYSWMLVDTQMVENVAWMAVARMTGKLFIYKNIVIHTSVIWVDLQQMKLDPLAVQPTIYETDGSDFIRGNKCLALSIFLLPWIRKKWTMIWIWFLLFQDSRWPLSFIQLSFLNSFKEFLMFNLFFKFLSIIP